MTPEEKVEKCAVEIKRYCKNKFCLECIFWDKKVGDCELSRMPKFWLVGCTVRRK